MKLRQLLSRKTRVERSSLTGILPRVQRMRQSCEWEPVVSPETIEEREQRLSQARKGIAWHPQTFDAAATTRDPNDETKRLTWLLAALVAAVFLICLSVELATPPPNHYVGRAFTYRLGSKPPYLAEPLAVSKAWEALQENGFKVVDLTITTRKSNPTAAPNGRWDEYLQRFGPYHGILEFERRDTNETYQVNVSLTNDRLDVAVTTNRIITVRRKKQ